MSPSRTIRTAPDLAGEEDLAVVLAMEEEGAAAAEGEEDGGGRLGGWMISEGRSVVLAAAGEN
jgi:hypothetical protein